MKVVSAKQMQEIDRRTIHERGVSAVELMEHAGKAIARGIAEFCEPGPVLVLCGKGNNGGDGFVAARILAENGFPTAVLPVLGVEGFSPEAQQAFNRLAETPVKILTLPKKEAFPALLAEADVLVDAMLGTGSRAELRAPLDWIVAAMNDTKLPMIAADLPTGLEATTGTIATTAIKAALTVTIGLPKLGMLTPTGVNHCGQVRVEPIQFPEDLLNDPALSCETVKLQDVALLLPNRPADSNKGTYGLVCVGAGSRWMPGAATLCALGALRSGVGLVRLYVPNSIYDYVVPQLPEALTFGHDEDFCETLTPLNDDQWEEFAHKAKAIVIGPGMGQSIAAKNFLAQVLSNPHLPVVIDADAINLIAKHQELRLKVHANCILTPHPGELARLLETTVEAVQQDRWSAAEQAREVFGCTIILKGFGTLVAPVGQARSIVHIPSGNTALSRGGSGDVLAGILGGLLAQGLNHRDAGILGTFLWGFAADLLVREGSSRGVMITDILNMLPKAFRELEKSLRTGL